LNGSALFMNIQALDTCFNLAQVVQSHDHLANGGGSTHYKAMFNVTYYGITFYSSAFFSKKKKVKEKKLKMKRFRSEGFTHKK